MSLEGRQLLAAAPYTVPLELVDIAPAGSTEPTYKLGINVGLGGGTPELYELDTGAGGFFASYNPKLTSNQWWANYTVEQANSLKISYASGNMYTANRVQTSVQLYTPSGIQVATTSDNVQLGQIVKFTNSESQKAVQKWTHALSKGLPPLDGHFYGDFGADLIPVGTSSTNAVFSILPQFPIPAGLTPGFILHVGKIGPNTAPYLQIGLTKDNLAEFDDTTKMNPYTGNLGATFPNTNIPTYSQKIASTTFSWTGKRGATQQFTNIPWLLDTGAPQVTVWQGNDLSVEKTFLNAPQKVQGLFTGRFKNGQTFSVQTTPLNPSDPTATLTIRKTGTEAGINEVEANIKGTVITDKAYVNTGLWSFTQYDVMYILGQGLLQFRQA